MTIEAKNLKEKVFPLANGREGEEGLPLPPKAVLGRMECLEAHSGRPPVGRLSVLLKTDLSKQPFLHPQTKTEMIIFCGLEIFLGVVAWVPLCDAFKESF